MALKRKYSICLWIVLLLGSVSCSQDKEINYQPSPVTGFNVGALDSERKMQWAQDIKELELGGELTVDILNSQNLDTNPITVRVQAWCKTDSSSRDFYSDLYFQNKLSIPVLNVLPPDALLSLSQQPLDCRIVLTLTDSLSSNRIYDLSNVKIKNSVEFNNIPFFAETTAPLLYENIKAEILMAGEQRLVCNDFSKAPNQSVETWEQLIQSSATDFSAWATTAQKCRLMVKTNESVFLSSSFILVFPQQELLIRPELHYFPSETLEVTSRQIITLKISNPNSFTVKLRVSELLNNRFNFIPIYSGIGAVGYIGSQRELPMTWSLQDTPYLKSSTENELVLELPGKQEITLDGFFHGKVHCDTEFLGRHWLTEATTQHFPYFVGIQYGFDFKLQLQTQLVGEMWQTSNLKQGVLTQMADGPITFWDLFYDQVRARFARGFKNPAKTTAEFIPMIRRDITYERCKVL